MANAQKGINIVLKVGEQVLAGQLGARLIQSASPIDITNKITGQWEEHFYGIKTWKVECNGLYAKNANSYQMLQEAFRANQLIDVEIIMDEHRYVGKAMLTEFPLTAVYNDTFKYNVRLLGDGELTLSE